jgi:hypothetical protein
MGARLPIPKNTLIYYQSVAPDGPSMPPPIKKETWVAGKQEGGAGRQSIVPAARLGTVLKVG